MAWICTSQEWDDSLNKSQVLEGRNTAERLCRHQWNSWGPHVAVFRGVYVTFRSDFATQNTKTKQNKTKHRNPPISSIALWMKSKIWQDQSSGLFSHSWFILCHSMFSPPQTQQSPFCHRTLWMLLALLGMFSAPYPSSLLFTILMSALSFSSLGSLLDSLA